MTRSAISPRQQNQVMEKNPSGVFPGWYAFDVSVSSTNTRTFFPSLYSFIISTIQGSPERAKNVAGPLFPSSRTTVVI